MATHRTLIIGLALVALVVGCGPRETPEQKLDRLRAAHDIRPTGLANITGENGEPQLLVDLRVTNQSSRELEKLTVLVRCTGPDGTEKLARRVTLDLAGLRPGLDTQKAALIPGFVSGEFDQVTVEIERGLTDQELRSLPEYDLVASGD